MYLVNNYKIDVNIKNKNGISPLMLAISTRNIEIF